MVFILFFLPVYKISTLDQDGTSKRSFFYFLNSYIMPREKPPTNYKKPLKIGFNALFITIETNKKK